MMAGRGRLIRFDAMFRVFLALLLVLTVAPFPSPPPAEAAPRLPAASQTLSAGTGHTLEIRPDGTLWAWGTNGPALGLGTGVNSVAVPTQVGTDNDWAYVAAGSSRSFAIKADGTLWAWGSNMNYALGVGDSTDRYVPTLVNGDTDWVAVDSQGGNGSTFALKADGTLWAWGYNGYGELGLGDTETRHIPVQVPGHADWVAFSMGGAHIIALKADGTVWTWGQNMMGELGLGYSSIPVGTPTLVAAAGKCVSVAAGWWHTTALRADGTLMAWGDNTAGQLGDGSNTQRTSPVVVGTGWVDVSAGMSHTIGVKADGTLWGWGNNVSGQVGDGTFEGRTTPVRLGDGVDWAAVSASTGGSRSFAVKADGSLWAWGYNWGGTLGTGEAGDVGAPSLVGAAYDWVSIAEGMRHTIAVRGDGTMWAAGDNSRGRLGLGIADTSVKVHTYMQIGSDTDWTEAVVSEEHNLALKSDGTLWAWGANDDGQLGVALDGAATHSDVPVQVGVDGDWAKIGVGEYASYAIKDDGSLWAWGWNRYGQLGLDSTEWNIWSPQMVDSDVPWVDVEADHSYAMGVKADGTLWGWGYYSSGRLGMSGLSDYPRAPMQVGEDADWVSLSCGHDHSLALKADGTLWGWGSNTGGQLGLGEDTNIVIWEPSRLLTNDWSVEHWYAISASEGFSHAVALDGTLWAWGNNGYAQLGDGTADRSWAPVQIGEADDWSVVSAGQYGGRALRHDGAMWAWGYDDGGARRFGDGSAAYTQYYTPKVIFGGMRESGQQPVDVAAGSNHALALKADGTLWGWGDNQYGQIGGTGTRLSPAPVDADSDWIEVAPGSNFTLALKADGTLWSWGYNNQGQLGLGDTMIPRSVPTQIGTGTDWISVVAGYNSGFALKSDGTLWSWGYNMEGQLGHGDNVSIKPTPTQVGTDTDWAEVFDSGAHTFALKADGTLWAWGVNYMGGLGLGDQDNRNAPEQVGTFDDWVAVSAGGGHSLGVRADGTLWAWGRGNNSQLGLGDTDNRLVPTQVAGTEWADVAAGSLYSLALKADGTIWAWGANDWGQLGTGDNTTRSIPIRIGSGSSWTGISTSSFSSHAIDAAGRVYSWGRNDSGQLGLGDTGVYRAPTFATAAGDVTAPVILGMRSTTHPVAGVAYRQGDFSSEVDVYDTGSHVVGYSWVIDQSTDTVPDGIVDTPGADSTILAENLDPGTWYLHVRAIDAGGNASAVVSRAVSVLAELETYTLTYTAGAGGTIQGDAVQTVVEGDDGTPVTALPNTGYTFERWSDGLTSATRTDTGVAADIAVTAEFSLEPVDPGPDPDPEPDPLPPVISGNNRYATAIAGSKAAFDLADAVVIATGEHFADALGGAGLAGALDSPLLLTEKASLPGPVMTEIGRLKAKKAYILGGIGAVSPAVESSLKAKLGDRNVIRIAGSNRYQTADRVAAETIKVLSAAGGYSGDAFIATGANFPDALGASPVAAAQGMPVFLADPARSSIALPAGVRRVWITGGNAVVSPQVEASLKTKLGTANVKRLAGGDRFATAAEVAKFGVSRKMVWNGVGITTGMNFPDALAAGPVLGSRDAVMLLTDANSVPAPTRNALSANRKAIDKVTFFGGDAAVPLAVRTTVNTVIR